MWLVSVGLSIIVDLVIYSFVTQACGPRAYVTTEPIYPMCAHECCVTTDMLHANVAKRSCYAMNKLNADHFNLVIGNWVGGLAL